jgi:vancomycin resistance protein YoaR
MRTSTAHTRSDSPLSPSTAQPVIVVICSLAMACCFAFPSGLQQDGSQSGSEEASGSRAEASSADDCTLVSSYQAASSSTEEARAANIKAASEAIDGTTIAPGATFSFNDTLGDVSKNSAYKDATVLDGTNNTQGPGGGICQVSTALYIAALEADMQIVERHPHSVPSDYAPMGLDATLDFGTMDLVVKNTSDYPLTIQSQADGQTVRVSLLGHPLADDTSINVTAGIVSTGTSSDSKGNDQTTYSVDSHRTYYQNGIAVRTELISEDTYRATSGSTAEAEGTNAK